MRKTIRLKNNTLKISLYKKPTQYQSYLPPHSFASIVFSQALRYKRICSDEKELSLQLTTLKMRLPHLDTNPKLSRTK